jgi:hypothetical protein
VTLFEPAFDAALRMAHHSTRSTSPQAVPKKTRPISRNPLSAVKGQSKANLPAARSSSSPAIQKKLRKPKNSVAPVIPAEPYHDDDDDVNECRSATPNSTPSSDGDSSRASDEEGPSVTTKVHKRQQASQIPPGFDEECKEASDEGEYLLNLSSLY